jgi:hypothetical protein
MLSSRLAASIAPVTPSRVERFDKGMEITLRGEFGTETTNTRNGSAARKTAVEKYMWKIEGVTRIGTGTRENEKVCLKQASP